MPPFFDIQIQEKTMRVLIIEDDFETANYIGKALSESDHESDHAADGELGLEYGRSKQYDVLIVDRMLPKKDGLTVIETLREEGINTPVLILSALDKVDERVKGLRSGGDDYLTKPFAFSELLARIEVLKRRLAPEQEDIDLTVGDLVIERLTQQVSRAGTPIQLVPREYRLLEFLMRHKDKVVTRTMLLENVWDYDFDPGTNVIDVHMSRLRSKIDKDFDRSLLQTIRGAGYKISDGP